MADESLQLPRNQNLDSHIISLFQRMESMSKDTSLYRLGGKLSSSMKAKQSMQVEIRTLEFWRYLYINSIFFHIFYIFDICIVNFCMQKKHFCSCWSIRFHFFSHFDIQRYKGEILHFIHKTFHFPA